MKESIKAVLEIIGYGILATVIYFGYILLLALWLLIVLYVLLTIFKDVIIFTILLLKTAIRSF